MKNKPLFLLSILSFATTLVASAQDYRKPRLVVQIVVSQMRYDYVDRFGANFSEKGFRRFQNEGVTFTGSRYDFMLTDTPTCLATLTTGSMPSTHGIIGDRWVDFLSGKTVDLVADGAAVGLHCDADLGCFSSNNMVAPTLGDRLLEESPKSKVVTLATSSQSAIVMGGFTSDVFWCDQTRGMWISSTHYMDDLPEWVVKYNQTRPADNHLGASWNPMLHREQYVNNRYSVLKVLSDPRFKPMANISSLFKKNEVLRDYPAVFSTPGGNAMVKEFAKQAIIYNDLGADDYTDLLNICFDATRSAGEIFGPESMEVEDMFCRLDEQIGELIDFIYTQVDREKVLIVLTSDHGASDSFDRAEQVRDRFNVPQFKVIVNGFMNAQYGSGDWVLEYNDRQLYLNHNLIYKQGLSLPEVQNRVAAFILQFRGVSHAMTSTALSTSSFASGYAKLIQNSFYPRRSGDIVVDLMPGWIEEDEQARSLSGSMYDYDTHVPLMMLMGRGSPMRIRAPVDMTMVAPTLARLMHINRPVAATGDEIKELTADLDY